VKGEDGFLWRFTGVYGESHHNQKHKMWEDLRELRVTPTKPWLCAGDFNKVLVADEKEEGGVRPEYTGLYVWHTSLRIWDGI
jgi:hypothetical protein